jgi:4'-phosphopantetheinyl transferase EntD
MRILPLPETWRDRALVISEVEDPARWFTDAELATAPALERRRHGWMLARIAAKQLAFDRGLTRDARSFVVTRSSSLSLSHSATFGAAAIDEAGVGIDIEVPREIDERATHLFLTEEEETQLHRCTSSWRLIHFWAAKEAAWKRESDRYATLRQLPLRLIETHERGLTFDKVETFDAGELIVALTSVPLLPLEREKVPRSGG